MTLDTRIDFIYLSEQDMIRAGVTDMPACVDTMEEMFGLKNPFPKMMIPKADHIRVFANPRFVENTLALANNNNCPIAIIPPPSMIQFLLPKKRSEINPPNIGVR